MKVESLTRIVTVFMLTTLPSLALCDLTTPQSGEPVRKLPHGMSSVWRAYFENVDFDGDGIRYIYDRYLGRNDKEVDFKAKLGGRLRGMSSELSTVDPIQATDTASSAIVNKYLDGLVQFVPYSTEIMPNLALAWEISEDARIYTFYLRRDVRFHNGAKFTADDFIFSYNRLINPVYASPRISFATDFIKRVEKIGDYTVRITLKKPFTPFLKLLTYDSFSVLPRGYVSAKETVTQEKAEYKWYDHPVGTGPFKVKEYVPGDHITLEAYDDYHEGRPYLDEWYVRFVEEEDTIIQAFKAGQIDVTGVPSRYWEEFRERYKDVMITKPQLSTFWLILNCGEWPFENRKIRQAFAYAMDRTGVINTIFKGRHIPAHGVLPPGLFGFSQELYDHYAYNYNPGKARRLLDEAGALDTDGDGIREYKGKPLKLELSSYVSADWKEAAKTWRTNLKEVGVEITYQQYDFPTILDMTDKGTFKMITLGWINDYPDPENWYILFESKNIPDPNSSRYTNPEVDRLVTQLRITPDPTKRRRITYEIERIIQADHPHIWFMHPRGSTVYHKWVHGWDFGPMGGHLEKRLDVWLDRDHR
ncbi:MAG TPA: ABC transporter substrate-binding protein [Candidatus Latescibacteria bacterium]|nr:ABC transporter substrate-binding protein [Candidatus Latescibacterota bacterium]